MSYPHRVMSIHLARESVSVWTSRVERVRALLGSWWVQIRHCPARLGGAPLLLKCFILSGALRL